MAELLNKSRYLAGLQCPRRAWLLVNEPLPFEPPTPGSPMAIGQEIGRRAQLLFPGGELIDDRSWRHAVTRTAAVIADGCAPAIFEGAFESDGVRIRVDVLERLRDGAWGLREVKSNTSLKDYHLDELALQCHVLSGTCVPVSSIELIHVNSAYVRGPDGVDWPDYFARVDVREMVTAKLSDMPDRLQALRDCLDDATLPFAEPESQCANPYDCEYWNRCTSDKPPDWIRYLPRLSQAQADRLKALGVEAIASIPADFPLSPRQAVIRDAVVSGNPYVGNDLKERLRPFGPPALYLDFEAMVPPIPLYEQTRPYQTIPFQWSLHRVDGDGALSHQQFLADGARDPRRLFAETLVEALAPSNLPIVVYSAYEESRLRELADRFSDLSADLDAIIARLADLLPVVRSSVYLPEFGFSNSIKAVGPALSPDFTYEDLDGVADGMAASAAFLQIASGAIDNTDEVARLRRQLLVYCEHDTLALVKAHEALRRLAAGGDR